jgi:hypothetical protein
LKHTEDNCFAFSSTAANTSATATYVSSIRFYHPALVSPTSSAQI